MNENAAALCRPRRDAMNDAADPISVTDDEAIERVSAEVYSGSGEIRRLEERVRTLEAENAKLRELRVALREPSTEELIGGDAGFRLLVESVEDYAIFMLDPRGNVATWNEGARRISGYNAEEIIGRHFSTFYPREDVEAGKCEWELDLATKDGRFEDEGWRVRKDGSCYWTNVVITALWSKTRDLVGFAKVTRDLTARVQAEEDRVRRARAEEEQREMQRTAEFRERFLAIVSHDLRNPISAIALSASLLLQSPELPPKLSKTAGRILANVKRMTSMVNDLLDFTRGRLGGGIPIDPKPIDLRQVAVPVIDELEQVHPLRQIVFEVRGDTYGTWDGDRVGQLLANLAGNALEHGDVAKPVRIDIVGDPDAVTLSVHNEGIPIAQDLLPHIFEPFRRGGSQDPRGGLGLGLFIASEIVRAHGGNIRVISNEQGTTFTAKLPRDVSKRS